MAEQVDEVEYLADLLDTANARVTFDSGRDCTHPCTFCGKRPQAAHDLVDIGTYPNGDKITRPVCKGCKPRAEAHCRQRPFVGPVPMALHCPKCCAEHVDRDEWATRPHRTHLCECGHEWDPCDFQTVGVETIVDEPEAKVRYSDSAYNGPGWYYSGPRHELGVGPFDSFEEAARHAATSYYRVRPPALARPAAPVKAVSGA